MPIDSGSPAERENRSAGELDREEHCGGTAKETRSDRPSPDVV